MTNDQKTKVMRKVKNLLSTEQYSSENVADHKMYIVHEVCKKMQDIKVDEITDGLVLKFFIPIYEEADNLFRDDKKAKRVNKVTDKKAETMRKVADKQVANVRADNKVESESSSRLGVSDMAQKPPKTVKPNPITISSIQAKAIVVRLANMIAKEIVNYERASGNKVFQ